MLNVFLTVNIELEFDQGKDVDLLFVDRFQRYIYGPTKRGHCGLPLLFNELSDYGLTGSFFVDPLLALKYGLQPLQEVVGLISEAEQEVQLQLHAGWVNQVVTRLFEEQTGQIASLRDLSLDQQSRLIKVGLDLLSHAGSSQVSAFRAGHYELNRSLLKALAANGIAIDCSYNKAGKAGVSDVVPEQLVLQPVHQDGVFLYPVSVFAEQTQRALRPLQLASCSNREFETVLFYAIEHQWDSVVIILRSFDLMTTGQARLDPVACRRLKKLFRLLSNHPDLFKVRGFTGLEPQAVEEQPEPPVSSRLNRYLSVAEQAVRHVL